MKSFEIFLSLLATIPAPRRAEGKLYRLPHILLFSILAVSSGANSYRGIRTFIRVHRKRLNQAFGIDWKRAPAHTSIRFILQGLKAAHVETAFRDHAGASDDAATIAGVRALALDGKALKGSFDAFNDAKARQVLSAFATDTALVLAHFEIDEKSNEIQAAQKLFAELDLSNRVVTLDAMRCQKNFRGGGRRERPSDHSTERKPADLVRARRRALLQGAAALLRANHRRQMPESSRNAERRRVRRRARSGGHRMGDPCRRHRCGRAYGSCVSAGDRSFQNLE